MPIVNRARGTVGVGQVTNKARDMSTVHVEIQSMYDVEIQATCSCTFGPCKDSVLESVPLPILIIHKQSTHSDPR